MTIRVDRAAPPAAAAAPVPAWLSSRPASPAGQALLVAVNLAVVTSFLLSYGRHGIGFAPFRIDLDVYRIGGRAWLRHGDLYGVLPSTSNGVRLPFTYPPVAAVLFSPLSLVPMAVAGTVLSLATITLTAVVLRLFLRSVAGPGAGSWWTIGWLLPVALLLEPMRHTLGYGQVNVALMVLVSADCLPATVRWPRGLLVGAAAAVKLTPAAFLLFFACRGDRRAMATAAVTFAACGAAGFPLAWHDSVRYWTSVVFQTGRPGSPANAANQSIQAVLVRAGLDPHTPAGTAAWLALSAVIVALAWYGMRHAVARSAHAWALSLNALAALLISPISWSHHWVWAEPALLVLAAGGLRDRRRGVLAGVAAGLAVLAAAPQWWFPAGGNRETHWAAWQQAIGGSYVILAAVILLLAACWTAAGARLAGYCQPKPTRSLSVPARNALLHSLRCPASAGFPWSPTQNASGQLLARDVLEALLRVLRGSAVRLGRGVRLHSGKRRNRSTRSMTKGTWHAAGGIASGRRHPRLPTQREEPMRTLHFGLRVADPGRSLAFYTAVGYEVVGSVPETPLGQLTMLKLPGDEFVTIELVHDPSQAEVSSDTGLSHFVIKVESLDATISELAARGIGAEAPVSPDGSGEFRTTWVIDPDGNRIELVQWPAGHADGITAADWAR